MANGDFSGTDVTGMNFGGANLHGTRLCGADLIGTNLSGVTGLSLHQLYKTDSRAMHADRMVRLARMRDLDECLTQALISRAGMDAAAGRQANQTR
ncbi:pentapeptide repeat-containing protein [Deinococcus sp. SM5_A1]|uniref:pentapeptide repeat-containing protein n=1 Tax=Deinococcus sp. SM5_A1 TaxID=3379094 RepID=UPI0038592FF4